MGTLKDGYVRNAPLLTRVKQIQSVSHDTSHELLTQSGCIQTGTQLPDYSPVSRLGLILTGSVFYGTVTF